MSGFSSKRLMALKRFDEHNEFEKPRDCKPLQIYLLVICISFLAVAVLVL
jgi:hypothetical protein